MANSVAQGRDLAKKHKKKLKNKIGKAIGYAGEVAKTVSDYGTPAGIAMTVVSKIKQKIKDRGMPKGPFKRISTEPTPEMIKRFEDGKVKRKMGGGMMKKPMGYDKGGEARVRGMGAAIKGGKFEGVF